MTTGAGAGGGGAGDGGGAGVAAGAGGGAAKADCVKDDCASAGDVAATSAAVSVNLWTRARARNQFPWLKRQIDATAPGVFVGFEQP
jgi:hypothetical protein